MTKKAFFVVVEYCSWHGELLSEVVGTTDDVEPEDWYMAIEDKDWLVLEWFESGTGDLVHQYYCPLDCTHADETLIDESPTGCEYQCNSCGFVRYEPYSLSKGEKSHA